MIHGLIRNQENRKYKSGLHKNSAFCLQKYKFDMSKII